MQQYQRFVPSFRHFIPRAKPQQGFPFRYEMEEIVIEPGSETTHLPHATTTFELNSRDDLAQKITESLITVFEFFKYLDEDSSQYLKTCPQCSPTYFIGVDIIEETQELNPKTGKKVKQKNKINTLLVKCFNFTSEYSYTLVKSVEHLNKILEGVKVLTYDAETSGLDPEFDTLGGINFSIGDKRGYYMPLRHKAPYDSHNLPEEALDIYYRVLLGAERVYLFNARFDIRFLEYMSYNLDQTKTNIVDKRYDMSRVKFFDTQISAYFADPDWKDTSLKWAEKHFLGYYRLDLSDTMKLYGRKDFDTTKLDPKNLVFYAGQDGISTFELGQTTEKYVTEFGLSGQIDMEIIYPLMDLENRLIRIDTEYVSREYHKVVERLGNLTHLIKESLGQEINLNSAPQKQALFKSFGLDTGVKTKSGAMSTARDAVDDMIERMRARGESIPEWLHYLGEQSKLQTLSSTFFGNLYDQMNYRNGRVRLNYRHGSTATGRFSSGKE